MERVASLKAILVKYVVLKCGTCSSLIFDFKRSARLRLGTRRARDIVYAIDALHRFVFDWLLAR